MALGVAGAGVALRKDVAFPFWKSCSCLLDLGFKHHISSFSIAQWSCAYKLRVNAVHLSLALGWFNRNPRLRIAQRWFPRAIFQLDRGGKYATF